MKREQKKKLHLENGRAGDLLGQNLEDRSVDVASDLLHHFESVESVRSIDRNAPILDRAVDEAVAVSEDVQLLHVAGGVVGLACVSAELIDCCQTTHRQVDGLHGECLLHGVDDGLLTGIADGSTNEGLDERRHILGNDVKTLCNQAALLIDVTTGDKGSGVSTLGVP